MYNLGVYKIICPSCRGNGYIRTSWEGEDQINQCKTCSSEGEIKKFRFVKGGKEEQDWALAAAMPTKPED